MGDGWGPGAGVVEGAGTALGSSLGAALGPGSEGLASGSEGEGLGDWGCVGAGLGLTDPPGVELSGPDAEGPPEGVLALPPSPPQAVKETIMERASKNAHSLFFIMLFLPNK